MNRDEFMRQLEQLLADVSEEEKREAMEYYRGYFEDAGEENEERIIRELESPEKVARIIKTDLGIAGAAAYGEYTEAGYQDSRFEEKQEMDCHQMSSGQKDASKSAAEDPAKKSGPGQDSGAYRQSQSGPGQDSGAYRQSQSGPGQTGGAYQQSQSGPGQGSGAYRQGQNNQNSSKTGKIVLIVVAAVITSPLWIALAAALFGGTIGVFGTLLGLFIAGIAVAGALYITGAAVFGVGIAQLATGGAATGLALLGAGLLIFAIAVLATIACVWVYGKFIPWVIRGIIKLCKGAFSGRGNAV